MTDELGEAVARGFEAGVTKAAEHAKDECMRCSKAPTKKILWAGHRARAWFCDKHAEDFQDEKDDDEITKVEDVEGGEVEKTGQSKGQSSYLDDFLAGVEPTGVFTFENARENEGETPGEYWGHQIAGMGGGFLGGAALSTALTGLGLMGAGRFARPVSESLGKNLMQSGADSLKAFNPKKLKAAIQLAPATAEAFSKRKNLLQRAGEMVDNPKQLVNNPKNITNQISPEDAKGVIDEAKEVGKTTGAYDELFGSSPEDDFREMAGIMGGAVTGGLGGTLSALSSATQYEAGANIRDLTTKESEAIKEGFEKGAQQATDLWDQEGSGLALGGTAAAGLGGLGYRDVGKIEQNINDWDEGLNEALERGKTMDKATKQIDEVFDAYVSGAKNVAGTRFMGIPAGKGFGGIIAGLGAFDAAPTDAGRAPHYLRYGKDQPLDELKLYQQMKKVPTQEFDEGAVSIMQQNKPIHQKITELNEAGYPKAADRFKKITSNYAGELYEIPTKYVQGTDKVTGLKPFFKGTRGVMGGLGALGLGAAALGGSEMAGLTDFLGE